MRTYRSLLIAPSFLVWAAALGFSACGASDGGAATGDAGAGGETGGGLTAGAAGETGSSSAGASGASAGGAGGAAGAVGDSGAGGEAGGAGSESAGAGGEGGGTVREVCDPTAQDLPDDDFADTNCDGIDGDASRAVFVAPIGSDQASGTITQPVATITRAAELAVAKQFAVYVCDGVYRENLVITRGVSIHGGYDCARDWLRVKDRAVVQPERGLPLLVNSGSDVVTLDRMAFRAGNAAKPGSSSQAGGILNSTKVLLSRVEFSAGDGARGLDGTPGDAAGELVEVGADGEDALRKDCVTEAPSGVCAATPGGGGGVSARCAFNGSTYDTSGGNGGDGVNPWLAQDQAYCLKPGTPINGGTLGRYRIGRGAWKSSPSPSTLTELPNLDGESGSGAEVGIGTLSGVMYVPSNAGASGSSGNPGLPGAGGDGGLSGISSSDVCSTGFSLGSGGGQGGPGGCGGAAGTGGLGGGSSIALVIVNSQVTLDWPSFFTGRGGLGGAGASGGAGAAGGKPGSAGRAAYSSFAGTSGEPGTDGGTGGSGGPGGGGPSIGILYVGTAPVVNSGAYTLGAPGPGGALMGGSAAATGVTGQLYALDP